MTMYTSENTVVETLPTNGRSTKLLLLLGVGVLFLLTLSVSTFFNHESFDEAYRRTIVDHYLLWSGQLANDLEKVICKNEDVSSDKDCLRNHTIGKLPDINEWLTNFRIQAVEFAYAREKSSIFANYESNEAIVSLTSSEGLVLYSSAPHLIGNLLKPEVTEGVNIGGATYSVEQGNYSISLALKDVNKVQWATLTVTLNEKLVGMLSGRMLDRHKSVLGPLFLGGLVLLIFVMSIAVPPTTLSGDKRKKQVIAITISIVCGAQIFAAAGESTVFVQNYQQIVVENADVIVEQRASDVLKLVFTGKLNDVLLNVGLEILIATAITLLCLVELLILIFKLLEKRLEKATFRRSSEKVHYSVIRPTIFLFLFGVDLTAVLIPLQMQELYEPMFGLPKEFVLSLPVTALFFSVGITFLIAGAWMDRRGWHEPFLTGVVLTGSCKFYAWLAPDALQFIIAMGGVGFGYGLALMAAQGFVMNNTSDNEKAHSIAYFFAGVYAGSIGGIAIGAMLAARIEYDRIFLIGSLFIFASLFYGVALLHKAFRRPDSGVTDKRVETRGKWPLMHFLLDRNVLNLIVFCSVPSAIAVIGFLNYFCPVYLNGIGVSESFIGGTLMLYGLSMVYVSPLIGKCIDTSDRKDLFITVGLVLGSFVFLSFYFLSGITATITGVLLLGLSGSFLQSSQTAYALKLRATNTLGTGKSIAIVRATSRLGQMLGPMVFSWLLIADDTEEAITYFGLAYLCAAILFMAFTKREGVPATSSNEQEDSGELSEARS